MSPEVVLKKPPVSDQIASLEPAWQLRGVTYEDNRREALILQSVNRPDFSNSTSRLHDLFDKQCKAMGNTGLQQKAIDYGEVSYSFSQLRNRANRLAVFLQSKGICAHDKVGLLLDRSIDLYACVLALSKLDAAFVPLDATFPPERIRFIIDDCAASHIISLRDYSKSLDRCNSTIVLLDDHHEEIAGLNAKPFKSPQITADEDPVAYIIYTSGSTGQPKGVPIRHSSICSFLNIARECYGFNSQDRVYQGLSLAFDFSFEEIWVPLLSGATLVPAPTESKLVGDDLYSFLVDHRITALCVVPTLLATIKPDLPELRLLLVSGEACPIDIINPWFKSGRRIINAYGPTETTVTATWSLMKQGSAVTIGGPLPGYTIVIIDPDTGLPVSQGSNGEICIAGIGLAEGYVNRQEQTEHAFISDFIGLPDNPRGKIYRTGDQGRFTSAGQIEYLGRIDTQVKIRGYRIETGEIEAVIRAVHAVEQAAVAVYNPDNNGDTLVAYLTWKNKEAPVDIAALDAEIKTVLPGYMAPTYYETLDSLPLLASDKVDRSNLPAPKSSRFIASGGTHIAPTTELEIQLTDILCSLLDLEKVSTRADFFDDLGADSLKLASFVTIIRKELGIRRISMRKLYENTTVVALAALLDELKQASEAAKKKTVKTSNKSDSQIASVSLSASSASSVETIHSTAAIASGQTDPDHHTASRTSAQHQTAPHVPSFLAAAGTGAAQVLVYAAAVFLLMVAAVQSHEWITESAFTVQLILRTVVATNFVFLLTSIGLILLKWLCIGRFTTEPIPLYSARYIRFWIAQRAIRSNPLNVFAGTPVYSTYLRLLGMSVGHGAIVMSQPPICTDLIRIGSRSVVRQDSVMTGYTVANGFIYPGNVDIGSNVLICEATVLDINTVIGDNSQLGTTSALLEGQTVPAASIWQGSPAVPTNVNFDRVKASKVSWSRKTVYTLMQLLTFSLISLPATALLVFLFLQTGLSIGQTNIGISAALIYLGGLVGSMVVVVLVPRLLHKFVKPEISHPLYGTQFELARTISRLSNNRMLNTIFGDSSMIIYWLSLVGYDLSKSTQTGSNFGVDQRHHSPFLCSFDRNTLVSDGLLMMNMETSFTAFKLRQVSMPPDTYVGNVVHYPADAKLGPNCLIATKAALPIEGPVRSNTGILGSPPFEIPRSVVRDRRFDHFKMPGILEQRLSMKLRSNLLTLALYMMRSWILVLVGLVLSITTLSLVAENSIQAKSLALTGSSLSFVFIAALFSILCERAVCGFSQLQPRYCSLYDQPFWNHERFWKLNYNAFITLFNGTPMKPFFLRLQGAVIGKGVFDDGAGMTEPAMTEVGDYSTLNYRASLQCHSLEDGTFKSDRISLGKQCTVGVGGFVHYGSVLHDGAVLETDSFLMKGSVIESKARWFGNPAHEDSTVLTPQEINYGSTA